MRSWFTPRRMTDPLSGASFNADERTNVDYHRGSAKRHDIELSLSLSLTPFVLSLYPSPRHTQGIVGQCVTLRGIA